MIFNETEQQRQKVRIYVTQTQHKRNKAPTKLRMSVFDMFLKR